MRRWPTLWALLVGGAYVAIALRRLDQGEAASWDNAIFEEAVRGYAHAGPPIVDVKGPGFNLLGDHFSPVLAFLAPVYRLFPHAQTLLIAQVVLIGVSVYVVCAVASRHLSRWPAIATSVAYGLSFGLQSAVMAEFHEVAFGVPLLALAGGAYVDGRYGAVVGWAVPLLLVKEDLGLTIAAIGAALWISGDRRRGWHLAAIGVLGTALIVTVVIPAFRNGTGYAYGFGGDGPWANLLVDPGRKGLTLLETFAVGGLVAVLSPWALVALPTLMWRFAADNPHYWGTSFHYSLIVLPIVAIAGIDAMRRHRWTALPGAVICLALTIWMFGASPVRQYLRAATWQPTAREIAAHAVLTTVPAGARVESDAGLIVQLTTGRHVTFAGTPGNAVPDWIVLDHRASAPMPSAAEFGQTRYGQRFRPVMTADTFDVARRVR